MSALDAEDVRRFSEATERVYELQEKLGMGAVSGVGTSSINVNAGGVGVWIACAAAACSFISAVFTGFLYVDLRNQHQMQMAVMQRKLDRMEDYQLTSYMLFPDFRKQIEANLKNRKKED